MVLVWSCLFLLPFGRSVEVPVLIMAVWAVILIRRGGRCVVWHGAARLYTLLFAVMWLPIAASLPDAVDPATTARVVVTFARLYLAGIFIVHALAEPLARQRFLRLCAWLLLAWVVDALLQAATGFDVLGYRFTAPRLNGVFGERHMKLGLVLATLAPLLFDYARRAWGLGARVTTVATAILAIFLSGSRGAWIMLAVVAAGYLGLSWRQRRVFPWRSVALAMVVAALTGVASYHQFPGFRARVHQSLAVLRGDTHSIDWALSYRLSIWETAGRIIRDHPINGIGARGFRVIYPDYAAAGDRFIDTDKGIGAYHPHQLLLEIASETGLIGLAGLLAFAGLLLGAWWRASPAQRRAMTPFALALAAAFFPLNTHLAIYSSFWSQVLWWLVALFCAATQWGADPPSAMSCETAGRAACSAPQTTLAEK